MNDSERRQKGTIIRSIRFVPGIVIRVFRSVYGIVKSFLGFAVRSGFWPAFYLCIGALLGIYYQGKQQVELQQHNLVTEFHCKTAELFNEAEFMDSKLVGRYGRDKVENGSIPREELEAFNRILKDLNVQLSKMFIVMKDDSYLKLYIRV